MRLNHFIAALFSFIFSISCMYSEHYLAISAIFQNEAPYLKEWIEYHHLAGAEKFYLYNNSSTDEYKEVLQPYLQTGIVELTDWPTPAGEAFVPCQKRAYNHCIKAHKEEAFWIAFIDLDEFIVPVQGMSIPAILKDYEDQGGLYVYWQNFGTSNLPSIPKDKLLIESLVMKYPFDHKGNRIGKSIVRPAKVSKYFLHNGAYRDGSHTVSSDGIVMDKTKDFSRLPVIDKIQINHYYTRAEDFFFGVKIARKQRIKPELAWSDKRIAQKLTGANKVRDETILKFVPELKKRMEGKPEGVKSAETLRS